MPIKLPWTFPNLAKWLRIAIIIVTAILAGLAGDALDLGDIAGDVMGEWNKPAPVVQPAAPAEVTGPLIETP